MVDLVLQGNGEKAVGFDLYFFFSFVDGGDLNLCGAAHFRGKIDDAQAALLPDDAPSARVMTGLMSL